MRKAYNTTIEESILEKFKLTCDEYGVKMNSVVECLMEYFSENEFNITLNKDGMKIDFSGGKNE